MFQLRTLGTLALERDGVPVEGISIHRNALALLAILAADGATSRDRVMALLWPESDSDRASGSLRQLLHHLRHRLGATDLFLGRPQLALDPAMIGSDVERFREALAAGEFATAASLYRGPFLDGAHFNGSPELEQWIDERRTALARDHAVALERAAEASNAGGDLRGAVLWWERRQELDPLDGRVTLELMRALAAAGRRHTALELAKAHSTLLLQETGLPPDPGVTTLAESLRQSLAAAPDPPAGALAESGQTGAAAPTAPPPASPTLNAIPPVAPTIAAPMPAPRRRRSLGLAAAAALLVVLAVAAMGRNGGSAEPAPDANLVAVAAFDVADPSLHIWREGLGDILASDLDGAGPLRTVPPSLALRQWTGRGDLASAEALGSRTGAGIVIFGSLFRRGGDSIGIRATVLDRARGVIERNLEVRGDVRQLGGMADSLGVRILRVLGEHRPVAATRRTSIGARSLPALKEFLLGEQFYRRLEIDSALAHFDRAITLDTTFALGYQRMNDLLGWGAPTASRYLANPAYSVRARPFNHGLGPRDSMLLLADSLAGFVRDAPTADALLGALFRAKQVLEELVRRYPTDALAWYELGDRHMHARYPAGGVHAEALAAFDRAIELDSGFAPAYVHAIELAFRMGDAERARRYVQAYMGQRYPSGYDPGVAFAARVLEAGGMNSPAVQRSLDSVNLSALVRAGLGHFAWSTDSGETAVAILRAIRDGRGDPRGVRPIWRDTLIQRQVLARALAFRGHLRAAVEESAPLNADAAAADFSFLNDPFWDLAAFGLVDEHLVRRAMAPAWDSDWSDGGFVLNLPRHLLALPWLAARGDSGTVKRYLGRSRAMLRETAGPMGRVRARYVGTAAEAYLALLRGDTAGAVTRFEAIPDSLCILGGCFEDKLVLARLLAAQGEDRRAEALLRHWQRSDVARPLDVVAALEHGRLAEQLGDTTGALRSYRFVTEAWRQADPELYGMVQEARGGTARMGGLAVERTALPAPAR